jgi:hypothetical protein
MPSATSLCEILGELLATTAAWAVFGAARCWFQTTDRIPAEEMATNIQTVVKPLFLSGSEPLKHGTVSHPQADELLRCFVELWRSSKKPMARRLATRRYRYAGLQLPIAGFASGTL